MLYFILEHTLILDYKRIILFTPIMDNNTYERSYNDKHRTDPNQGTTGTN